MNVAILGNRAASFVRPMSEGLARMFQALGVQPKIFYDGLRDLNRLPPRIGRYLREHREGGYCRTLARYLFREFPALASLRELRAFDLVVVVNSLPDVFLKRFFRDDTLRALLPHTPIVLYDVFYLPTRGPWAQWLKEGRQERGIDQPGNWGMERYDWYLCSSVVSEYPMPAGPQPCSVIGLNLDDGTLVPGEKSEFAALIDFEQPQHMKERCIQIQACEETGTPYVVLHGRYPVEKIREIYRRSSLYFVAHRESFGLPICELQACGSYIVTPYANWCPSHWLKDDLAQPGPGTLSPNFVVYDNDKNVLIDRILQIKARYKATEVVDTFHRYHPQLFYGDMDALSAFVRGVKSGSIHSNSHSGYANIVPVPDVATA